MSHNLKNIPLGGPPDTRPAFPLTGQEVVSSGTGFIISGSGLVATNYHVIQPTVYYYNLTYPAPVTEIRIFHNSGSQQHKVLSGYIIAADQENDIAVLGIKEEMVLPSLKVDHTEKLIETMPVWVFGYPFGDAFTVIQRGPEITVTKGTISALRHDDKGVLQQIQIDAAVNPGNSGGPVIDDNGRVIGIVKIAMGKSQVNFSVPSRFLHELMEKTNTSSLKAGELNLSITSRPSKAQVFLNWKSQGATPVTQMKTRPGWHALCLMKEGFQIHMEERTLDASLSIAMELSPIKTISVVPPSSKDRKTKQKAAWEATTSWHKNIKPILDKNNLILSQDFDDRSAFDSWEQYTGGTDKRTWFLEKSSLHQFESTKVLHAIYLGDSSWNDYTVKALVKITDEHDDSRAGLIFRETSEGFYLFRIHKESDKAQLAYHCKRPFGWFIISEKKLDQDITNKWYSLTVHSQANAILCYFDTMCVFAARAEYSGRGRIGFYSVESKASFDSLRVYKPVPASQKSDLKPGTELLSFWFSDYFNLKSNWWYQYTSERGKPEPWFFSNGGCAQLKVDQKTRYSEFTKYRLKDFGMELLMSSGAEKDSGSFEIFFRKNKSGSASLVFSKKKRAVELITRKGRKTKVLKRKTLPKSFFDNTFMLDLTVKGDVVSCAAAQNPILKYNGGKLFRGEGRMGFAVSGLRLVLHQMTMYSAR
jgi:hypothetical protein